MTSINADFYAPHTPQDSEFARIEASFEAIASQYKQAHHRLLVLHKVAAFHGIPPYLFKKCFELWLQSRLEGGEI